MSSLLTECLPWLPRSTLICLKSCWSAVLKHYFGTWNSKQTGTFNLAEELVAYCESDVKLRKEDCLTLKRLFEQQAHFNPFDHRTIASACNESRGYKVVQMWECQWSKLKQDNPAVRDFVNQLDIVAPLNPRDAFCGGRMNPIKLYHQVLWFS